MATALVALGLEAHAVGGPEAPPLHSSDKTNCEWCSEHGATLVTHDRGKKDREILEMLNEHQVPAIVVLKELRTKPPHFLARALLTAEAKMDQEASHKRLRHYLRVNGGLAKVRR
jgi:HD superfamily phosphohydrolase YqeK